MKPFLDFDFTFAQQHNQREDNKKSENKDDDD